MLWITRARPVIDRIACPWLITRRLDHDAQFLFAAPEEVLVLAKQTGGTAFDIEGATYTHVGEACSFDALIAAHPELQADAALGALAAIVRAADTDKLPESPPAAGLLAVCLGLRRIHRRDQALIEAGFAVYDAMYEWCAHEQRSRHGWPTLAGLN